MVGVPVEIGWLIGVDPDDSNPEEICEAPRVQQENRGVSSQLAKSGCGGSYRISELVGLDSQMWKNGADGREELDVLASDESDPEFSSEVVWLGVHARGGEVLLWNELTQPELIRGLGRVVYRLRGRRQFGLPLR